MLWAMTVRRASLHLAVLASVVALGIAWHPAAPLSAQVEAGTNGGRDIWLSQCAVCHGARGKGTDRGVEIEHRGTAAIDFQVRTGRMPLDQPDQAMRRRKPELSPQQITELVAYTGGFVEGPKAGAPSSDRADLGDGGALYLEQCAACHQAVGAGGALAYGDVAPPLYQATSRDIGEAIRTGPGNMPQFAAGSLDDAQVADITVYVRHLREPGDRGGLDLGHLGPVPEGLVAIVGGLGALILVLRWLGTSRADDAR